MNPSQLPPSPLPPTEQPAAPQPEPIQSNQPPSPPDDKMIQALLATTRAEMEQEGKRRAETEALSQQGYIAKLLHSPRRLAILVILTLLSLIVSVVAAKVGL